MGTQDYTVKYPLCVISSHVFSVSLLSFSPSHLCSSPSRPRIMPLSRKLIFDRSAQTVSASHQWGISTLLQHPLTIQSQYDELARLHASPFYSWWIAAADGLLSLKIPGRRAWWIAPGLSHQSPHHHHRQRHHHHQQKLKCEQYVVTQQTHRATAVAFLSIRIFRHFCSDTFTPQLCKHQYA